MATDQILCLQHEGIWFYFLPTGYSPATWTAVAGDRSEVLEQMGKPRWFKGTLLAERLVKRSPSNGVVIGFQLDDSSAASERFPMVLTMEEWKSRTDRDDAPEASLYSSIVESQPDHEAVFEGPWLMYDGEPAPVGGNWSAKLPYDLIHHSELLHLFPGTMSGFRAALKERLNKIPGITAYDQEEFSIYAKVEYDPPQYRTVGKGRAVRQVSTTMTRSETIRPPREITGVNRADAVRKWNESMDTYLALGTEMTTVKPCATCKGTGVGPVEKVGT